MEWYADQEAALPQGTGQAFNSLEATYWTATDTIRRPTGTV
jgi:hypothetical protein